LIRQGGVARPLAAMDEAILPNGRGNEKAGGASGDRPLFRPG
jgi:hypothetical protein